MAGLTTFPTTVPKLNDLLLGTEIKENGNITRNFRIGEVLALMGNTGLTPVTVNYGLFSQTEDSQNITNTTTTRTLSKNGVGSQIIAANTMLVGDTFNIKSTGVVSSVNGTVLTLIVTTSAGVVLASSGPITMRGAVSKNWCLDIDINVRKVGAAGTASIVTGGSFTYNRDSDFAAEMANFLFNNNATFDTTVPNTIIVTAAWSTASTSNSIYSSMYNFTKTY